MYILKLQNLLLFFHLLSNSQQGGGCCCLVCVVLLFFWWESEILLLHTCSSKWRGKNVFSTSVKNNKKFTFQLEITISKTGSGTASGTSSVSTLVPLSCFSTT